MKVPRFLAASWLLFFLLPPVRGLSSPLQAGDDARSLETRAAELVSKRRFRSAADLLKRALRIREKEDGPQSQLTGRTLYNLSFVLSRLGRNREALEAGRRALAIARRGGDPSLGTAMARRNLAEICEKAGLFREARDLAERAVKDFEKVRGKSLDAARAREYAGTLAFRAGDYSKALEHWAWALAIREKLLGPNLPGGRADLALRLARTLVHLGEPDPALALQGAAQVWLGGEEPWKRDRVLLERFGLLLSLENRAGAARILEDYLAERRGDPGFLGNCAGLFLELGMPARARELFGAWRKAGPNLNERGVLQSLDLEAGILEGLGRWKEALEKARKADSFWKRSRGKDAPPRLENLLLRCRALRRLGRLDEAFQGLDDFMNIMREAFGEDSFLLAPVFQDLAEVERRARGATPELLDYLEMAEACLARTAPMEAAKRLRWNRWVLGRGPWESLDAGWAFLAKKRPKRFARAFRALDRLRERSLLEGFAPWAEGISRKVPALRKYLELLDRERRMDFPPARRPEEKKLFARAAGELRRASPFWAEMFDPAGADPAEVRKRLGGKGVLLRFVRAAGRYGVLLVRGGDPGSEKVLDLGPEGEIESRAGAFGRGGPGFRKAGRLLGKLLLDPLGMDFGEIDTLVLVPAGVTAFLPWAALPVAGGGFLGGKVRLVFAVSAGSWLRAERAGKRPGTGKGAAQVGFAPADGNFLPFRAEAAGEVLSSGDGPSLLPGVRPVVAGEGELLSGGRAGRLRGLGILHFRIPVLVGRAGPAGNFLWAGPGRRDPRLSLWERPDGLVTPGEILGLSLGGTAAVWDLRRAGGPDPSGAQAAGVFCLVRALAGAGASRVLLAGPSPAGGAGAARKRFEKILLEHLAKDPSSGALYAAQREWIEAAGKDEASLDPRVWASFRWWVCGAR